MTAEELISVYGEKYRTVIEDSLSWLEYKENEWGIGPLDRVAYVADIISHISVEGDIDVCHRCCGTSPDGQGYVGRPFSEQAE